MWPHAPFRAWVGVSGHVGPRLQLTGGQVEWEWEYEARASGPSRLGHADIEDRHQPPAGAAARMARALLVLCPGNVDVGWCWCWGVSVGVAHGLRHTSLLFILV